MGSLELGVQQPKRIPLVRPLTSSNSSRSFFHRPRSRLARFLLFEKVDYVQWVCTAATFFFVVILFQAFLPDKSGGDGQVVVVHPGGGEGGGRVPQLGDLDFGDGIRFVPWKLLEKFDKERREANLSAAMHGRTMLRAALLRPRLALLLPDLSPDATHLRMLTLALALKETGYDIEVFALEDGPVRSVWESSGFPVSVTPYKKKTGMRVDWLRYNGVIVNGLDAKPFISCLSQEPYNSVPAIWVIHQKSLAQRLEYYNATNSIQLINDWKQAFTRVSVVVFQSHFLTMLYSTFDVGNFFVVPDSSTEAWMADCYIHLHGPDLRTKLGYNREDFVISIVGSEFLYSGLLLEHMLVLESLSPLLQGILPASDVKVGILNMNSSMPYNKTLEILASTHGFQRGGIYEISSNEAMIPFLHISDVVIYGSLLEVQSFPSILVQAMCLEKLIIAPELAIIKQYVDHRVNGYLFPKENINMLTQTMTEIISNGKLTQLAHNVASMGKKLARNMMVPETVEGYAFLLENIVRLPSEVAMPKAVDEISLALRNKWRWDLFENYTHLNHLNSSKRSIIDTLEGKWLPQMENSSNIPRVLDEAFSSIDWVEERAAEISNARKRLLEEELKDRTNQFHGTWEDVYRNAKKADRLKNELHERDDRELERTGQPLCIYEPYYGEGAWHFLHNTSLYRGIGMSAKGRRHGADDIDASSRLPILNSAYYREVLGEYGAFFALANRVDRIHKNAWIGFQSWRVSAMQVSLTKTAESMLLDAIESHKHGDAMYFWVRMDRDPRNPNNKDFWDFCDAINAGNCRFAVSEALRRMYGVPHELNSLPAMPSDGDSWSVMHSWAMPTKSFLEFVMFSRGFIVCNANCGIYLENNLLQVIIQVCHLDIFSYNCRMFVDALDAQMYEEHHHSGHCYLSLFKDRRCYSRVLELLVNVWAYHSAKRMVYLDPETGALQEQHKFKSRRGHMWVKWFSPATLKNMDEDLAEEFDMEHPARRWLWPSTGEVFWQGVYERERSMRQQQKERRKQQSRDKIRRIRKRARQKTLGKYVKPPPEEDDSNTTTTSTNVI